MVGGTNLGGGGGKKIAPPPPPPLQTFVKFSGSPGATLMVNIQQIIFKLGILTNKGIFFSHVIRFLQTDPSQKLKNPVGLFFATT